MNTHINKLLSKYNILGTMDEDDIKSECAEAMWLAGKTFKPDLGVKLSTYQYAAAENRIRNIKKKATRDRKREVDYMWVSEPPKPFYKEIEDMCAVEEVSVSLSPIENAVVQLHYFKCLTFEEIGNIVNRTRQRIQQIQKGAIHKMRLAYGQ